MKFSFQHEIHLVLRMFRRVETVYYSHYGGETLNALITASCMRHNSIVCFTLCPGAIYLWNNSTSSARWDSTCSVVALNKFSITWKIRNSLKKECSFQKTDLIINPLNRMITPEHHVIIWLNPNLGSLFGWSWDSDGRTQQWKFQPFHFISFISFIP